MDSLADEFVPIEVKQGEIILQVDQPVDAFWVIVEGTAVILVRGEVVAERSTGDFLGEMGALLGQSASATVQAGTALIALRISAERFQELVPRSTLLQLLKTTGDRRLELGLRLAESLQHTSQGLVRVDHQGRITSDISSQCLKYLGSQNVYDLRFKNFSQLVESLSPGFMHSWDSFELLFDPEYNEEQRQMIFSVLPERILLTTGTDLGQLHLQLSYYSCLDSKGRLIGLDIGMTDITSEMALADFEHKQKIRSRLLAEPEAYLSLLALAKKLQSKLPVSKVETIRLDLHTLKGNAGMFELKALCKICHSLEDQIKLGEFFSETVEDFNEQVAFVSSFFEQLSEPLKQRLLGFVIDPARFYELQSLLKSGDIKQALSIVSQASSVPASDWAKSYDREIQRLASKLGKKVEFISEGDPVRIPHHLRETLQPLIHLVRNSIVHGLETSDERIAMGKTETGKFLFKANQQGKWLVLQFIDDGRGLDAKKIKIKAQKKFGLATHRRVLKTAEMCELIFHADLSTEDGVNQNAGRGIGLSAVKESIEAMGGKVSVSNRPGKGFEVEIKIPTHRAHP